MARNDYRFNERTLRYEPVEPGLWSRLKRRLPAFISGGILTVLASFALLYYAGKSPFTQFHLEKENQRLKEEFQELSAELDEVDRTLGQIKERDDSLYRTLFGADPIPENIRRSGVGGSDRYEELKNYPNSELLVRTHSKLDRLAKSLQVQEESFRELMGIAEKKKELMTHIPAIRPIRGDRIDRIASGFGRRFHPIYRIIRMHEGIDFTVDIGTPIHSTGDGVVKRIEKNRAGYGHNIIIDHGHGYETLYAHLSGFEVKKGEKVERGDVIGRSGNTGTSTGPHLHYEVIEEGEKVDPVDYFFSELTPKEYQRVVKAAEHAQRSL